MKNYHINILIFFQLITFSILIILFYYEFSFWNCLTGHAASVDITADNKEAFGFLLEWTQEKEIESAHFDESQDGYTAVYLLPDKLKEIKEKDIVLSPFRPIQIRSLTEAEHIGYSSLYFVSLGSSDEIETMRVDLQENGITIEPRGFYSPFMLALSDTWINWNRVYTLACLLASFVLVSFIFCLKHVRDYLRLNATGENVILSSFRIIKKLFYNVPMIIATFGIYLAWAVIVAVYGNIRYIVSVSVLFWILYLLHILEYAIMIALGFCFMCILNRTKNRYSNWIITTTCFVTKTLLALLCVLAVSKTISTIDYLYIDGRNLILTRNYPNIYKVVMNYIGSDQSLEKENEVRIFAQRAYEELKDRHNGFFMDSNDVACNDIMCPNIEQDGLNHNGCDTHVTVTPNYYNLNPIWTTDGEPVESKLDYDENTINLAVPEKYMHLKDQMIEQFTEYLDFNRFLIGERVYQNASNETWKPNRGPLSVNVIAVKDGQSYYSFNDSFRKEENNAIVDAVAVIYTDNFHPSYILFTSSRALFFQYDDEKTVDNYLEKITGIKGFLRADSVYKSFKKDFELDLFDLAVALLSLGIIIMGYWQIGKILFEKRSNILFQVIPAIVGLGLCYLASGLRFMRIMRFDAVKGMIFLAILEAILLFAESRRETGVTNGQSVDTRYNP